MAFRPLRAKSGHLRRKKSSIRGLGLSGDKNGFAKASAFLFKKNWSLWEFSQWPERSCPILAACHSRKGQHHVQASFDHIGGGFHVDRQRRRLGTRSSYLRSSWFPNQPGSSFHLGL